MKVAKFAILGLLALLAPVSSYAKLSCAPAGMHALFHKSQPKATKLKGPYSVGNKKTKHSTYKYLGQKGKHQKVSSYKSPVSGNTLYGKPTK
jgi:hypothetical protein